MRKITQILQIHEGPTRIAMKRDKPAGLEPGMFFSDEPGYYKVLLDVYNIFFFNIIKEQQNLKSSPFRDFLFNCNLGLFVKNL